MLISLTVGKVDAGVAVLLTEDKRLIEFPSILLPPSISSGSIVDITVSRNHASEAAAQDAFDQLQASIYDTYGRASPEPPTLRLRNATQTSVVLEWDPIQLATADLRSLALYRNGAKAGAIPRPRDVTATKISGLAVDHEYSFQLVLRTSAGTRASPRLAVRTHKMTDLRGITVTPGVMPAQLRYALAGAVERIGGRLAEGVRIDTTHFVCTEGRGREWERAVETNVPVVRPEWVEGCEREGRVVGVRAYYLNADPKLRQIGPGVAQQQQQQQQPPGAGRQRTASGADAPRVPPATGDSIAAGSAREPHMAVPPPDSADTDASGVSPGTVRNGAAARAAADAGAVPPTPPAKDRGSGRPPPPPPQRAPSSDGSSASPVEPPARATGGDASVSPVDGASEPEAEDDDEEDEDEDAELAADGEQVEVARSPQGPRTLIQSPFDSTQKATDVPYRGGPSLAQEQKKEPSEGGSFSEVQL